MDFVPKGTRLQYWLVLPFPYKGFSSCNSWTFFNSTWTTGLTRGARCHRGREGSSKGCRHLIRGVLQIIQDGPNFKLITGPSRWMTARHPDHRAETGASVRSTWIESFSPQHSQFHLSIFLGKTDRSRNPWRFNPCTRARSSKAVFLWDWHLQPCSLPRHSLGACWAVCCLRYVYTHTCV